MLGGESGRLASWDPGKEGGLGGVASGRGVARGQCSATVALCSPFSDMRLIRPALAHQSLFFSPREKNRQEKAVSENSALSNITTGIQPAVTDA